MFSQNNDIIAIVVPFGNLNIKLPLFYSKEKKKKKLRLVLPEELGFGTNCCQNFNTTHLNTSTCSAILALSCSGIFFMASLAVVTPEISGYSSTTSELPPIAPKGYSALEMKLDGDSLEIKLEVDF